MSSVVVKPVTSWSERRAFLGLPWVLYKGDPNWVPPLRMSQKELVGYSRHPFYEKNEVQTFLAWRDGRPVGRIAAIHNRGHNELYKEARGFWGFFESIDDPAVAGGLFDAVRDWFALRSIHLLRGPTNPSLNYECGLLIDGFDSPPTFMMTYNKPYYGALVEGWGFSKSQDLFAYMGHVDMLETLDQKLSFIVKLATERFNVKLRSMDTTRFTQEVEMFLEIYNSSLPGTWGFVPLSPAEVKHLAKGLKLLIVPELAIAAEVDGKPVGAVFALPDYNPRIKATDGRLFPFGFIKLLWNKRGIRRMRLLSTNVVPEYQRWGIGLVLAAGFVPKVREYGIQEAEFSWVLESNSLSRGTIERGGAKLTKTYRIYDWQLAPALTAS